MMVDPGNTLTTALSIGILNNNRNFSDSISPQDPNDFYEFSLTQNSRVNFSLTGLSDFTYLELIADIDQDGSVDFNEEIRDDRGTQGTDAIFSADLSPGTYYARVRPSGSNDSSIYTLNLRPTATPSSLSADPGNTILDARNIGTLRSTAKIYRDNVGPLDQNDFYRFSLTQATKVNMLLSGLSDFAYIELIADIDQDGSVDFNEEIRDDRGSTGDNASFTADLGPGEYFARVRPNQVYDSTNYTLRFTPRPIPANTPSEPGNTFFEALNIGTLRTTAKSFRNNVGPLDQNDFYRFSLTQATKVNMLLSGLSDFAYIELFADIDQDGAADFNEEIRDDRGSIGDNASFTVDLGPGEYFARVRPNQVYDSTNYTLRFSPTLIPTNNSSDPGETLGQATDIGALSRPRRFKDTVGPLDLNDLYRFRLTQASTVNLNLSQLSDFAYISIVSDTDRDGIIDFNETLDRDRGSQGDNAVVNLDLGPGTYFARVYPNQVYDSTYYQLDISARVTTPSSSDDYIIGTFQNDVVNALAGNDRIEGRAGNDILNGSRGTDTLLGNEGNDLLLGGSGDDFLIGSLDNDTLIGGIGRDTLSGGSGRDRFDLKNLAERNDRITDFNPAQDLFRLSAAGFGRGLVGGAPILSARFVLGAAANDPNDRVLYDRSSGALFFDRDGSGAGNKVLLAVLQNKPVINHTDIFIT